MIQYEFLVVGVDGLANYAEKSEDLKVLLLMVMGSFSFGNIVAGEVLNNLSIDEVIDEEEIVSEELLKKVLLARLVVGDDVVEDELEPLGDVHLEERVFADQLVDDLVEGVVEFEELFALVVLVGEDILFEVHLHEVEQLEEQFADSEVLADHLPLEDGENCISEELLC